MNKLYFLLLALVLAAPLGMRAQGTDSLRQQLAHVFAPLDKSQVPTRLLAEYGTPLVKLAPFNGPLADSTRTSPALFRALYYTLATACIYGPNPLPDLPIYNQRVLAAEAASETSIPVMVQRIDYATLRPDALSAGLLQVQGGQLYDVPGRPASPYLSRTLFAAPYRIVAVSQGSQCGIGLFQPYTELIRASGDLNFLNLPTNLLLYGLKGDIVVNALPNAGLANRIADTHVYFEISIFTLPVFRHDVVRKNFECPANLLFTIDGEFGSTEAIPRCVV